MLRLYYTRLSDTEAFSDHFFYPYISRETRNKLMDYKNAKVRREKLTGESMLRILLQRIGGQPAKSWKVVRGECGKPYLTGTPVPLFFNLSHSGDYVVCAIGDREMGVDIQKLGQGKLEVARRFFHPEEIRELEKWTGREQRDLFYRFWAIKESFLKYTGQGLSASLSAFRVVFFQGRATVYQGGDELPVQVSACKIAPDYMCFVCSGTSESPEILPFSFQEK